MGSIEDEILEIEKYIRTLDSNDDTHKEVNAMIRDGMSKGLIYDFFNPACLYRGTMFSTQVIKQEAVDDFQSYIQRCELEEYNKYLKWKEEIINSGIEFSKDELKYNKML
jgi:hypothetical protein